MVVTPEIVTTGSGEVTTSPDRATVYVGVQSKAPTAAAAAADNARRQKAVLDTLRAMGLSSAQLSTLNYSITPDVQYDRAGGAPRVTGYSVTNTVRAEVLRLEEVGRLIDAALDKGANQISSLEFFSSNSDDARRRALAAAVVNARGDAESMARAAGGNIGNLIELSTGASSVVPMDMVRSSAKLQLAAPTPIEPGTQTVRATVVARWTFIPR
jgi:uncharacterized protein YggE